MSDDGADSRRGAAAGGAEDARRDAARAEPGGDSQARPASPEPGPAPHVAEPAGSATADSRQAAEPPRAGRGAWLALPLALAALALGAWQEYSGSLRRQSGSAQLDARLAELEGRLAAQRGGALARLEEAQRELRRHQARQAAERQAQYERLQAMLRSQRERLRELGGGERDEWKLAEAAHLLRFANQRLVMAGDSRSALAMLGSADSMLRELDDPALHPVRRRIAEDIAALRAVPPLDLEGVWLRLRALARQVDSLDSLELPDAPAGAPAEAEPGQPRQADRRAAPAGRSAAPEPPADAEPRQSGLRAALARLSGYVVVRRRETPYQAMLDPAQEQLARQRLRALLEWAQTALLAGNQALYSASVGDARRWLGEYFSHPEAAVNAMDEELAALAEVQVERQLPDISGALAALGAAMRGGQRAEGGQ